MLGPGPARWLWLSLAILVVDRSTKAVIEAYTTENYHRNVVPGLITLVHSRNPGIAFGLLSDAGSKWVTVLLVGGSIVVIGLLAWLLVTGRAGRRNGQAGLALILGGAAGNLTDRLLRGGVTDFFEVQLRGYHWPAFNFADSAISVGAVLVVVELLFGDPHPTGEKA
ncbi:MAG TPA: signal peptidase II [Candidatus Acidoferrales bacterium]|jgi:signal peptidase II|nr:signal peptidase II [Candidatus Acidoferrales bacterium]